ncbi:hypothetical protein [Serratia liquefaciens]|uniref:hypothetical protein n=1 Tax=Serratia liquefaciens TaxID=614 RepID=UPI001F120D47|nr:hypothetical protein [Serratia liquefaciens]
MFNIEYKPISSLESIASDACSSINPDEYKINLILSYEISTASLIENVLSDVHQLAKQWSADECPQNLYFNHGQYKVGGVDNIISELKEKPSSNRALYSLINQETIMNSGDNPIPSFLKAWYFPEEFHVFFNMDTEDFVIDGNPRGWRH